MRGCCRAAVEGLYSSFSLQHSLQEKGCCIVFDCSLGVKKDVNMVEMSSYYVLGVVGWCLGAYTEVHNTWICHVHTFLHTGPASTTAIQHSRPVPRPHIYTASIQRCRAL